MHLVAFGIIAGALWALLPGFLSGLLRVPLDLLVLGTVGGITGVVVTLLSTGLYRWCGTGVLPLLLATALSPFLGGAIFGLLLGGAPRVWPASSIAMLLQHQVTEGLMIFYGILWMVLAWLVLPLALATQLALRSTLAAAVLRRSRGVERRSRLFFLLIISVFTERTVLNEFHAPALARL